MNAIISEIVIREDAILRRTTDTGIYWMPEKALVYEVWKKLRFQNKYLKIDRKIVWEREIRIHPKFGPVDLVGKENDRWTYAIEFKMAQKKEDYKKDIQKLEKIMVYHDGLKAAFCALLDLYQGDEKESRRIKYLDELADAGKIKFIGELNSFKTKYNRIKTVSCHMQFWEVLQRNNN